MDLFGEPPSPSSLENKDVQGAAPVASIPVPEHEGLQHPRNMSFCLGHNSAEKSLLKSYSEGAVPHGMIFAGQKGIGKATLAYRFARFLLKYGVPDLNQDSLFGNGIGGTYTSLDVSMDDPVFRRVASGGHADFMSVERAYDATKNKYKDNVAVDEIRKIPSFLRMTASDGGWRVVIIDDADTMNRNAQNALLKILEEPPKNSILILVTHRLGALIPTIRSRTQVHHFNPLSQDNVQSLLKKNGVNNSDIRTLSLIAEGSVGKAVIYADEGGLDILGNISDVFDHYPDWNWTQIHTLADQLAVANAAQAYNNFQDLLCWVFSQLVVRKARGINSASIDLLDKPALQALFQSSSLEKLMEICENLQVHFAKVRRANLDKRQAVLAAFAKISA